MVKNKKITPKEKEPTMRDLAKLIVGVSRSVETTNNLVESLAISTKAGFDKVDERFAELHDEMNGKFAKVDKRFDKVESDIVGIKKDLNIVKTDVAVIKTDLRNLDGKIGLVSKRNREDIDAIASDLVLVKKKVSV